MSTDPCQAYSFEYLKTFTYIYLLTLSLTHYLLLTDLLTYLDARCTLHTLGGGNVLKRCMPAISNTNRNVEEEKYILRTGTS